MRRIKSHLANGAKSSQSKNLRWIAQFLSKLYRRGTVHGRRRSTSVPVSLVNVNARFNLVIYNEKLSSATRILDTKSQMFRIGDQYSIAKFQCCISLSKVEDGESDRDRKSDINVHKRIGGVHKSRPKAPQDVKIHQTRHSIHKADHQLQQTQLSRS